MDYAVVESSSLKELEDRVNKYAALGWRPCGGIATQRERVSGPLCYIQAVFKEGSAPKNGGPMFGMQVKLPKKRGRPPKFKSPL